VSKVARGDLFDIFFFSYSDCIYPPLAFLSPNEALITVLRRCVESYKASLFFFRPFPDRMSACLPQRTTNFLRFWQMGPFDGWAHLYTVVPAYRFAVCPPCSAPGHPPLCSTASTAPPVMRRRNYYSLPQWLFAYFWRNSPQN